jgi:hypothetical protein
MAGDGKVPRDDFNFDQWSVTEPADDLLVKPAFGDMVGMDPESVEAGSAVVGEILTALLEYLGAIDRKLAIAVNNYPTEELRMPKAACWSGDIVDTTLRIQADRAGFMTTQKKWGAYGTAGVLTYEIAGTDQKLAVMWSVPKGIGYKNWFKLSVIKNTVPTNVALFDDMYYDLGKLTIGKCAPADGGSAAWTNGAWRLEGVMGTSGECTLNTSIERK